MFCARCGEQIPDASELCPLCGQEANLKLIAQPAPAVPSRPEFPIGSLPVVHGPKGVGGWLLFYCMSLTILGPAFVLLGYWFTFKLQGLSPRMLHGFSSRLLFSTAQVMYGIVVGVLLWTRRRVALMFLRVYFILVAAETLLFMLEAVNFSLRTHAPVFLSSRLSSVAISGGITLLWFVYFRKSIRVKNT